MKEREEQKKKVIEDKILVKDASVKEIKQQKIAIIEQKKELDLHKRLVKKETIAETIEQRYRLQGKSLERIDEEDQKYKLQKEEKKKV